MYEIEFYDFITSGEPCGPSSYTAGSIVIVLVCVMPYSGCFYVLFERRFKFKGRSLLHRCFF